MCKAIRGKMLRTLAIVVLGLLVSGQASAQEDGSSGNFWLKQCTDEASLGTCLGFIMGIEHGLALGAATWGIREIKIYCTGDEVTNGQRKDIYAKYLRNHPETRHAPAAILYARAMTEAFPCKR